MSLTQRIRIRREWKGAKIETAPFYNHSVDTTVLPGTYYCYVVCSHSFSSFRLRSAYHLSKCRYYNITSAIEIISLRGLKVLFLSWAPRRKKAKRSNSATSNPSPVPALTPAAQPLSLKKDKEVQSIIIIIATICSYT